MNKEIEIERGLERRGGDADSEGTQSRAQTNEDIEERERQGEK